MKGSSVDKPSAPKGYTLDEKIGEGASARVWLGTNNQLQKQVAIKIITKSYLKDPNQKNKFLHEIQLHGMANHPYIAQLFGVKDNVFNYYLIMEYLPRGTLLEKVMSVGHLSENETLRFFTQIASAVKYLHGTLHVVHRDLKLDNIMIDDNDNLKLIDFGFSHDYSPEDEKLNTPCGSPRYTAPEMYSGSPYTRAVDVWSLGIILYVMITGKFPFEGENIRKLSKAVMTKEPNYPLEIPKNIIALIKGMLAKDPKKRLTIDTILGCSYIKKFLHSHPLKTDRSTKLLSEDDRSAIVQDLTTEEPLSLSSLSANISNSSPRFSLLGTTDPKAITTKLCQSGKFKPKDAAATPSPMKAGHRRKQSLVPSSGDKLSQDWSPIKNRVLRKKKKSIM